MVVTMRIISTGPMMIPQGPTKVTHRDRLDVVAADD